MNDIRTEKGLFIKTLELIGSIISLLLFATILYGIFSAELEKMLWNLFDWLINILKPIGAIVGLFVFAFRGIPLIVGFMESLYMEMRMDRDSIDIWNQFESTPTLLATTQNLATQATPGSNFAPNNQSGGGDNVIVWVNEGNGAIALHVKKGTPEYDNAVKRRSESLKAAYEKNSIAEQKELELRANEKLKELQPRLMCKKRTTDVQEIDNDFNS